MAFSTKFDQQLVHCITTAIFLVFAILHVAIRSIKMDLIFTWCSKNWGGKILILCGFHKLKVKYRCRNYSFVKLQGGNHEIYLYPLAPIINIASVIARQLWRFFRVKKSKQISIWCINFWEWTNFWDINWHHFVSAGYYL